MGVVSKRVGFVAGVAALIAVGACSGKSTPMDSSLKRDLAAAGGKSGMQLANSVSSQLVISADEAGPQSTPARAPHKISPKPPVTPVNHPAAQVATVPTPAPQPVVAAPVPAAPTIQEPAPRQAEPPPLPPMTRPTTHGQDQQRGVYKSEGQIFQQMPWIKP